MPRWSNPPGPTCLPQQALSRKFSPMQAPHPHPVPGPVKSIQAQPCRPKPKCKPHPTRENPSSPPSIIFRLHSNNYPHSFPTTTPHLNSKWTPFPSTHSPLFSVHSVHIVHIVHIVHNVHNVHFVHHPPAPIPRLRFPSTTRFCLPYTLFWLPTKHPVFRGTPPSMTLPSSRLR